MKDKKRLIEENKELKAHLAEAEELLAAIKDGAVDVFVTDNQKVFTLKGADHAFRILVETMNEGTATLTLDGVVMYCNSTLSKLIGLPTAEIIGRSISDFIETEEAARFKMLLRQSRNKTTRAEFQIKQNGKKPIPVLAACNYLALENASLCLVVTDLTEPKRAESSIKAALREKEVMLKEIHHRVKNNLQVIASLLRLQSETVRDNETAALFLDSGERVRAMALVHEHLYGSSDLARINFSTYVASLVRNLYRTFGLTSTTTPPKVAVDDVFLSLDLAVPCGLLLTELISNAVKYAYPGKKGGPMEVRFIKMKSGHFELRVTDHGVGFPKGFDWTKSETLGLRLVRLLTEQLKGKALFENKNGIRCTIRFKEHVL